MSYVFLLCGWLLALILGMAIVPKILLISYKKRLFDIPDGRKVHTVPVPRLGGLSFFPVILITMCLMLGIRYYLGYPIENLSPHVVLCEFLFFAVGCMTLYLTGVTACCWYGPVNGSIRWEACLAYTACLYISVCLLPCS